MEKMVLVVWSIAVVGMLLTGIGYCVHAVSSGRPKREMVSTVLTVIGFGSLVVAYLITFLVIPVLLIAGYR